MLNSALFAKTYLMNCSGQSWSIGGKQKQTLSSPLVGAGDGLSGSHNKYESDASPGRGGK